MNRTPVPEMRLNLVLPTEVLMVASAIFKRGEKCPTVEVAVYHSSHDAGEPDERLEGESSFGHLAARLFFPSSGCAVTIRRHTITHTEPGLQGFIGKRISVIKLPNRHDVVLVVWNTTNATNVTHWRRGYYRRGLREQIITAILGLSDAFA